MRLLLFGMHKTPKKVTFLSGQKPQGVFRSARWEISERRETEIDPEQDGF